MFIFFQEKSKKNPLIPYLVRVHYKQPGFRKILQHREKDEQVELLQGEFFDFIPVKDLKVCV